MNRIFLCEDKKHGQKVLLRLYGGKILEGENILRSGGFEREVLVFYTMAQKGIAPQLYGVFSGGRLEEYLEGHIPTTEDFRDPQLMAVFARKLARIHVTRLPLTKTPRDYVSEIQRELDAHWESYIQSLKDIELPDDPGTQAAADMVYNYDIHGMNNWFRETFPQIKHKVVLMHGDMNGGNCLVRDNVADIEDKIILLDYEFTSYSYRGIDIGNHFGARTLDMTAIMSGKLVSSLYPSEEERRHFIRAYLEEVQKDPDYDFDETVDNVYNVLLEAEFFGAIYDLFLNAWVIGNQEKFGSVFADFPIHPVMFMARTIRILEDRKKLTIDLMKREKL